MSGTNDNLRTPPGTAAIQSVLDVLGQSAHFGVLLVDAQSRVVWVNAACCNLLGLKLTVGEDITTVLASLPGRDAPSQCDGGDWLQHSDGRHFVHWHEQPVDDRPPAALLVTVWDETDARRREDALLLEESRHHLVLEAAAHPIWEWDLRNNLSRFAGPWRELLNLAEGSELGLRAIRSAILPDEEPAVWKQLEHHAQSGEHFEAEFRIKRGDQRIVWARMSGRSIRDHDGKPWRMIGNLVDITDRKFIEHAEKIELIGRMAGSIAHDFNNLLTIVRGHAQLLQTSKTLTGNEREAVDHIVEATRRGAHMTQQMLSLARKQENAPRVVGLNELIEVEARLLPRMLGEDIEVRYSPAALPLRVMIDPTQLHQVLANLAINARDAMPRGGTISLVLGSRDNLATIEVRDTGHGIPPDVLPRLFEPFFTTKAPGQGTGLGLPSSHAIITQAGGTIEVETVIGHGTTFRLCLPMVQEQGQETPGGNPYTTSKIPPRVRVARILVVEDEDPVRDIVNQVLQSAGHEVTTAASGEEALKAMRDAAKPFELLVTDVMMPRMGGRVLTDAARQIHADIAVLFISGYAPDEKLLTEIGCGVENFLQKPFSINDLLRKVGQVLGT